MLKAKFSNPLLILACLAAGKSLMRASLNVKLKKISLQGNVLDIGSKGAFTSSYYRHFKIEKNTHFVFTDLNASSGCQFVDIEERLPFQDASYDALLALNVLEHVYDHSLFRGEVERVLKIGGRLILFIPFYHEYHADPDDFYRFTDRALQKIWDGGRLQIESIEAVGEGPISNLMIRLVHLFFPRYLRNLISCFVYLVTIPFDFLLSCRHDPLGRSYVNNFAAGYLLIVKRRLVE